MGQSIRNANDAMSITQVADGALSGSADIIGRIRTLAVQAAQDGQSADSRQAIQGEMTTRSSPWIISPRHSFNGQQLLTALLQASLFRLAAKR